MTLGLGIFLSTLLVVSFLLFRSVGERWEIKKILNNIAITILKNLAIWMVSSICGIALVIWGINYYINLPTKQTSYNGISLRMSKPEVRLAMGEPTNVGEIDAKLGGVAIHVTKASETPSGKSITKYDFWSYDINDEKVSINVTFDSALKNVKEISCYSVTDYCQPILGISTGTSEESVVDKLGKPTKEKVDGAIKSMIYSNLNLKFRLENKAVYMLTVTTSENW